MGLAHPHAERAAIAAEAAARQGRFWDMHEKLFRNQGSLSDNDLLRYAKELELNIEQFKADLNSAAGKKHIKHDIDTAIRSGVRSSNNLFINDVRYMGAMTLEAVLDAVGQKNVNSVQ